MTTQDKKSIIQSIEKIPQILNLFKEHNILTLHDIHRYSGFTKTSSLRMCNSLVNIGFLEKEMIGQTPYYRLGIGLYRLGVLAMEALDIHNHSRKYLTAISQELQDNSYLFIERDGKALCVDKVRGNYYIQTNTTNIGDIMPFYIGGGSQAMLSHYNQEKQEQILSELELPDSKKQALRAKLEKFRKQGYALSKEEFSPGTAAMGVPIYDVTGQVVGAFSVGGIVDRFKDDRIPLIEKTLKHYAGLLSEELGYTDIKTRNI